MKKVYPVIFTKAEDGILIEVPDMGILTEGKDMPTAIDMARDAIGLKGISMEDDTLEISTPSKFEDVKPEKGVFAEVGQGIVSLVDIDFSEYRRKVDNKTVRKNLTIPNWLNVEAEKAGVNFSKVLQEALMNTLDIVR